MRYKQIILFYTLALPISLALRFIQLFFVIEPETGFYKQDFGVWGGSITAIIMAIAFVIIVFSKFAHRAPEKMPPVKLGLSISSVLFAAAIMAELVLGGETFGAVMWQKTLLYVFGVVFALWLLAFAIKDYLKFRLPAVIAVIPCFYFVVKIICIFAGISSLALISDHILLILAYCAVLLFMLQFAKALNNIDTERGFRKLLATGLISSILCVVQSVPNIVFHFVSENGYLHIAMITNVVMLFTGLFITVFTLSHFSRKNADR